MAHGIMSIPKVSTVHQGFAGTFTHMDGEMVEKRKRGRNIYEVPETRNI